MNIVLPETGYVRLPVVLAVFPVGATKWKEGVRAGIYPAPIKLGPRINAWRASEIRALIENPPPVKGAPAPKKPAATKRARADAQAA